MTEVGADPAASVTLPVEPARQVARA